MNDKITYKSLNNLHKAFTKAESKEFKVMWGMHYLKLASKHGLASIYNETQIPLELKVIHGGKQ